MSYPVSTLRIRTSPSVVKPFSASIIDDSRIVHFLFVLLPSGKQSSFDSEQNRNSDEFEDSSVCIFISNIDFLLERQASVLARIRG